MFALLLTLTIATQNPMLVSTEWLAEHAGLSRVIVVEVGDDFTYAKGHIPGARLLRWENLVVERDGLANELPSGEQLESLFTSLGIGDTTRVVFYSREPLKATRAWFTIDYLCHGHRASVLDGGLQKWIGEGRPLSREWPEVKAAKFTSFLNPATTIAFDRLRALVQKRGKLDVPLVVIDARPTMQFLGIEAGKDIDRSGHIPGAINIPWTTNLMPDEKRFRTREELLAMYDGANLTHDSILIAYCRSGVEASMTYFALRYLGYDVALYDGSFLEWSGKETAIAKVINP